MQESDMKKIDNDIGMECVVKSNNGYGRLSLGKLGTKFNVNDVVYVLSESEYQSLMQSDNDSADEDSIEKDINSTFENLLEISLTPIQETHKEHIKDKDNQIKQMNAKLNAMEHKCNQLKDKINQLSLWDMVLRKKHYDIINDFTNSIWIINNEDDNMLDADVPAIAGDDKQEQ